MLKYFKRTRKKDKLDTGILPDLAGLLRSDIFYWYHKSVPVCVSSAKGKGDHEGRAAENSVTAKLRYYSKTFPGVASMVTCP